MGMSKPSSTNFFPTIQCFTLTEIAVRNEVDVCIKESLMVNEYSTEFLYAQLF